MASGPATVVVAVDIGGTKMTASRIGPTGLPEGTPHRAPTGRAASSEELWSTLVAMTDRCLSGRADESPVRLGISCAGPFVTAGSVVSPVNLPAWVDFPLRARLEAHYPEAGIAIANDGLCMTLGEQIAGAAQGYDDVMGVTVSTGVGGGVIRGGEPVHGVSGNAGHIGHLASDRLGRRCWCGATGCLETVASGPSATSWARSQGWMPATSPDGQALAADAERGVAVAVEAIRRSGAAVGAAVAGAVALLDVPAVVIGGGFARSGPIFWRSLLDGFTAHAGLSFVTRTQVRPAHLGDVAPLVGAAALAMRHEGIDP